MNGDQADAMVNLAPADWATADEIRRRRFSVVSDGYSPDEVHDYLGHLAGTFGTLRSQIRALHRTAAVAAATTEAAKLLATAHDEATRVRAGAEQEAGAARAEADRRITEALEFRDMVLIELRGAVERIAAAAPASPSDAPPVPADARG